MKTLVLGATTHPSRYAFLAINMLRDYGHEVVAVGRDEGDVRDVKIERDIPKDTQIDTVTLYLNPRNQKGYLEEIIKAKPRRIIFNPGTENEELEDLAEKNGIESVIGCTLVMLRSGQY